MRAIPFSFVMALGCGGIPAGAGTDSRTPYARLASDGSLVERGFMARGQRVGCWERFHDSEVVRERGCYAAGSKVGLWRRFDERGAVIAEGGYEADLPHGEWRTLFSSGVIESSGRYRFGLKQGTWIHYRQDGRREESIAYRSGMRHGTQRQFDVAGRLVLEQEWALGRKHGLRTVWDEAGEIREIGSYKEDEKIGWWWTFAADGSLVREAIYRGGVLHGPVVDFWESTGKRRTLTTYERGIRRGPFAEWDMRGQLLFEGSFEHDRRHGIWAVYREDGSLHALLPYRNGLIDGQVQEYDRAGKLSATRQYASGERARAR